MASKQLHHSEIINRISREFGSPIEFSPVEFDEQQALDPSQLSPDHDNNDGSPTFSSDSLTLPWDLEGNDHAEEEDVKSPQHEKPHGDDDFGYGSGLSYDNAKTDRQLKNHHCDEKQQQEIIAHNRQQSLRLRAAKYFRGSISANRHLSNSPISQAENTDIESSNKAKINLISSPSPTSTVSTEASSISTKNAIPPRHSSDAKQTLNFFPKTRVASPPTIPSRASPTLSDKSNSSSKAKTEITTMTGSYSKYSDPPLGCYTDDMQSTVSASATSVSYGSDLENAARRILGRKRLVQSNNSFGYGSESEGYVNEERGTIGNVATSVTSGLSAKQKRPSRERMQKVTGRSIGMPARYGSDSEIESDIEENRLDTKIDEEEVNQVPPFQVSGRKSSTSGFQGDNRQLAHVPYYQDDEMAAILKSNAEKNLRRSQNNSSDEEDEANDHQNGAFPSFRPDPPDKVDNPGEVYDHENIIFNEFDEDWNAIPSSHWADPEKVFQPIVGHDGDEYYENEFVADTKHSLNYTRSDIIEKESNCAWADDIGHEQQAEWASRAIYQVIDAGEDADNEDEEKFDGNDYFHDFSLKPDRSWGLNSQQTSWEDLPSPVKFSPSRQARGQVSCNDRVVVDSQPEEPDDEYVTRTSEIDFFAWDDDSKANKGNPGDFDTHQPSNVRQDDGGLPNQTHDLSFDESNLSSIAPEGVHHPSDSDTPSRKARNALSFFRSRNNYNSDGERSVSDWESSPGKSNSFGVSPMRSSRWKNKQKMLSPRGLNFFGERRQDKHKKVEKEPAIVTQYEMLRKDSEFSKSFAENASNNETSGRYGQGAEQTEPATKSIAASEFDQTKPIVLRSSPEEQQKRAIAHASSNKSSTTVANNLNDSIMTQATPLMSNKALKNGLPCPPSFGKNHTRGSDSENNKLNSVSSRLPPRLAENPADKKNAISKRIKPSSLGFTGSDIIIDDEDDGACSISTLHTESLGSLVTLPIPPRVRKTDVSVMSGFSEIERLRKENEQLREKLENRSEASSRVSSAYVKTLKEQNELLRLQLNSAKSRTVRRNDSDMMYKSTIATLLEQEDHTRPRRIRRKDHSNAPKKSRSAGKSANLLIHGADFDGESITTYSESVEGKKVHLVRDPNCEGPGILQAIAAQVKTAAQDRKNPSKKTISCEPLSRPMELVTACSRKDRANDRLRACGSTTHSTKDVIGRALGCIKSNHADGKPTAKTKTGSVETQSDSASDDFIQKAGFHNDPKVKYSSKEGVSFQL